jgi:hypothetical protein
MLVPWVLTSATGNIRLVISIRRLACWATASIASSRSFSSHLPLSPPNIFTSHRKPPEMHLVLPSPSLSQDTHHLSCSSLPCERGRERDTSSSIIIATLLRDAFCNRAGCCFWLLLNDHLNIRNLLRRKQFNIPTVNCVLCSHGIEETIKHLILECEFAYMCWTSLHIIWDLSLPVIEMIQEHKGEFPNGYFMEVIIIASCIIWIHRNSFIFDNQQVFAVRWKELRDLFILWTHRAKPSLEADMMAWLSSL